MKKIYLILLAAFMVYGCYDDKGNYSYKEFDEVEILLPAQSYEVFFGDKLHISPTVKTDIPENDLTYTWEVYGNSKANPFPYWQQYLPVDTNKTMDYTCTQDEYTIREAGIYDFRLNVTQISSGRHFYSETVAVKIGWPSYTGAMVLHGDDAVSDIGIIVADEFQLTAASSPREPQIFPHYYSGMNEGKGIVGKGQWLLQTYGLNGQTWRDNIVIIAATDESSAVCGDNLVKTGEWNDLFYGGLNKNNPQGCMVCLGSIIAFDGGDIFTKGGSTSRFILPMVSSSEREVYPGLYFPEGGQISRLAFDIKSRGFINISYNSYFFTTTYTELEANINEEITSVPFNPADMKADLIYMDGGGTGEHVLAIMRKDNGDYFMAELDMLASSYAGIPKYIYDLSRITDIQGNNVINWAFASSYINMCFYATSSGVYQFAADAGNTIEPQPLKDVSAPVVFDGTITLMKLLNPNIEGKPEGYYMSGLEMVVATYGNGPGTGKLYSIELDPFSGRAKTVKTYTGFDKIYDVNIKGL